MATIDQRSKKLKAGKEKLAAFLKKKSKAKKTDQENKDTTGSQNDDEQGFPEVSSPSAFSVTDESELKSVMLYEPDLADDEQNVVNTEQSRHTLGSYILQSSSSEQNIISDIETAVSKRDELISRLTESLQASFWQNIPNDEVMVQVQVLVEHVGTLQAQLLQADQSLQEQLELHEASALALQAAKEQMLQLQFILNCKDAELDRVIQKVHKNTQSKHSYSVKEINTENSQESCLMCEQYSDKVRILEEELYNKIREHERSFIQQEWLAREQQSSVSVKSQEGVLFQESRQLEEHEIMYSCESQQTSLQEQTVSGVDKEQLQILESQLAKLKHEQHSEAGDISTLSTNFGAGASNVSHPPSWESHHNEYTMQHSQCLSQIKHLTSLNLDLQEKLSSLSSVEKDLAVLRCEYEQLYASYQEEIQRKFHHSELYAQINATYSSEKDILIAKITELQNEVARLQTALPSPAAGDNISEQNLVAQLQRELMQKDDELRVKLAQLTEVQSVSNKLRCDYESLEKTLLSYEEVIASLTQQLQATEHGQQDAELEVMTQELKIEQVVNDFQNRLKEKDLECRQYTENIIKLQDELLSNQHIHQVEISQKEQQLESIEDHMTVLDSERAKLAEKVKHLEHRLKMECQQYMDNLQHVMAEKENECKQYTENIVRLQDELMSFQHAHDIEVSEKNYCYERIEEQMEVLNTEKANLQQKVKDLEHKIAASYQQNVDVSNVKRLVEITSNSDVEDVKIQNELLTTQNVSKLQMLEQVNQTERLEKEVKVLTAEKTVLLQKVFMLEQDFNARCKQMKEAEEIKAEPESQLQLVLADRLQRNVDALTTEMFFVKKNMPDSDHQISLNHDLDLKFSELDFSVDNHGTATHNEHVQSQCAYLYEVSNIADSGNKDLLHTQNLKLHDMVSKFEYERKLAIQCRLETEQLQAKISVIDMNEERHMKAALQAIVDDFLRAQEEFSRHFESVLKQMVCFETQEEEKISSQAELLEQKQTVRSEPEQEICQEALQAQLKSTISQWQKLQFIVQEKEIELHRLQESFDEQQRINSSVMRFHDEQRYLLQAEIESLKAVIEQNNKAGIWIDNQQYDVQPSVGSVSSELGEIINKASENESAVNNDECLAQKEIEISDLKTSLALKESENSELVTRLTLFQEEIVNLKNKICDLQHQGNTIKENMKQRESEVGILKDSLFDNIDEKEIDLINWKIISESQVRDLKSVITERESEIDRLKLVNAEIFSENKALKNQLEASDFTLWDLKNCLANRASEVNVLNNAITDNEAEIGTLKNLIASKEAEVDVLRSTIVAVKSEINAFKESLAVKQTEINEIQQQFENIKSENTVLKRVLDEKEAEVNDLKRSSESGDHVLGAGFAIDKLETVIHKSYSMDKETETHLLEIGLTDVESGLNAFESSSIVDREINDLNLSRGDSGNSANIGALENVQVDRALLKSVSKEILDGAKVEMNVLAVTERELEIDSLQQQLLHTESLVAELTKDCALKDAEIEILVANLADRNCEIHSLKSSILVEEVKMIKVNKSVTEKNASELESAEVKNSLVVQTVQTMNLQSTQEDKEAQVLEMKLKLSERESEILSLKNDLTNKDSELLVVKESLEVKEREASDLKNIVSGVFSEVDYLQGKLNDKEEELYCAIESLYDANADLDRTKLQVEYCNGDDRQVKTVKESGAEMLKDRLVEAENQNSLFQTSVVERELELVAVPNYISEKNSESIVLKDNTETISQNDVPQSAANQTDDLADKKPTIAADEMENQLGRINYAVYCTDELQSTASEVDLEVTNLKQSLAEKEFEINILKVDLNEAKNQLQTLQATFGQVNEEMAAGRNIVFERDSQIQILTERLNESEITSDAFKTSLDETEDRLMKLRNIVDEKDSEIYILTGKAGNAISQAELLQSDVIKKDEELAALRQAVLEKESEIRILAEKFAESSSHLNALNNLVSNSDEDQVDTTKSVKVKESEIRSIKEALGEANKNESEVLPLIEELSNATKKVDSLNEIICNKSEELATLKIRLENSNMEIWSLNEQLHKANSNLDALFMDVRNAHEELMAVKSTSENKDIEISSLKEQLQEANSHVDMLNTELRKVNEELNTIKNSLESKDKEINGLNEQNTLLQEVSSNVDVLYSNLRHTDEEVTSIKTILEDKELEIITLNTKLREASSEVKVLNMDFNKASEELAATKSTMENKEMEINVLNQKLQEVNSHVEVLNTDLNKANEELAATQSTLGNKDMEINVLNETLQEVNSRVEVLNTDLNKANEELAATKSTLGNKDMEINVLNETLQEVNSHVEVLNTDLNKASEELAATKSTLGNKDMEINVLNETLQEVNSRVEVLNTDLNKESEELAATKSTLGNKDMEINVLNETLQEVNSRVEVLNTDLNKASEELAAVKNSMGNKDTEISILNEKLQEVNSYVNTQQTGLKIAHEELAVLKSCVENKDTEIITLTNKFQEANCCMNILRCDLENANEELVAIKSAIVNNTLEMSVSNKILQESKHSVQMLQADLTKTKEELASKKSSLENRDLEIGNLNEQLRDANSHVEVLNTDLEKANEELAAIKSSLENRHLEIGNLNEQLQEANSHVEVLNTDLRSALEDVGVIKSSLESKDMEINNLKKQIEQLQEVSNNIDMLHATVKNSNEEITTMKISLENKDLEIRTLIEKLQEGTSHVDALNTELKKTNGELADVKNILENKSMEISKLNEELQEAEKHVYMQQTDLKNTNEKVLATQVSLENKDLEISTLNERLQESSSLVDVLNKELKMATEELAATKDTLGIKDMDISALIEELQEANSRVDILDIDHENVREELAAVKSMLKTRDMEIRSFNTQLQESSRNIDTLHIDLRNVRQELAAQNSTVGNNSLEISNLNERLHKANCDLDVLHTDLRNTNEELMAVKSTLENKNIEISSLNEQLQETNMHVDVLNTELKEARDNVAIIKSSSEDKEREINSLNEQLQEANCKVDVLQTDLRNTDEELAALKNTLESKELEVRSFNERVQESDNSVAILQADLRNANEELLGLKNGITERDSEICALMEELSVKESKLSNLSEELSKTGSKVEELQNNANEDLAALNQSLLMNESELAALKEKLSESKFQVSSLTTDLNTTTDELAETKACLEKKESEISALTEKHTEVISQVNTLNNNLIKIDEDLKVARDSEIAAESRCTLLEQQLSSSLSPREALQTRLNENEESLALVTKEKNDVQMQLLTLQDQLEALGVNLLELKTEHSDLKLVLGAHQESKNDLQSIIIQKEREISELTSQVTSLEQQMKEMSENAEIRKAAEKLQKTEIEAKEVEFEHMKVQLLQEIENLKKCIGEKESAIAELIAVTTTAKNEYLLQELNTEKKNLTLEATLSVMSQEGQEKAATIVLQELKLQEQAEEISQLTDKVNHISEKLQEINEMNISLQQLNEALNSESHAHLKDITHQREALEQQVVEMEGLLALKERDISEIMQSAEDNKVTLEQLSAQHLALERNYKTLLGMSSHLQAEMLVKESTLTEQMLHLDEQAVRLNDLAEALTQFTLSVNEANDLNNTLKAEIDVLQGNKCDLEQKMAKMQSEFDSQELTATQFMVESKQLSEKLTQMNYDLDTKDATIFDLQHDCDMYIKEINHLKQELEQKDLISISLKQEAESSCSLMERSREEKEMLKANFDSCMEEVQQKLSDQEIELKRLRAHLAEETKNVCQDQNQMKEIYEQQIGQMEEKLLQSEKQCERLEKELTEVKVKSASAKDVYEHQLSEQELQIQSTNSELLKLKDHLSKVTNNHKCEMAGLKRLHEIQTNELEESCLALERTVAELKRLNSENTLKFNRERSDLEQNYEIQLSDVEEKRRVSEMEISRLKKHLDEMKFDHEKDLQSLEKSYEARLYELEDKYCNATNELEKYRKSLFSAGGYSEERQSAEMRVEELETLQRDLQNRNSLLEDDIAMMRTHAHCREEEMKAVLTNAAEEQQRKTAELNLEILHLQQQLSECYHKHDEVVVEIKKEYESQVTELQSRNRQLEEKICSLEMLIEEDSALEMDGNNHESKQKREMSAHMKENTSLKTNVSSLNNPDRASNFSAMDPQFSPIDFDTFPSHDHSLGDCLAPSDENVPIVEGFVAEPSVKFLASHRISQSNAVNMFNKSIEKADFVEEQCDGFQPELPVHSLSQCSDHPIHEDVIRERFEPEAQDHFLLETLEESANAMWQHEMSVDLSPSHKQSQRAIFDYSTPEKLQRSEEFAGNGRIQDNLFSNFNSNCSNRDLQSSYQLEKSDASFEKRLIDIKEELEEEYVTKMRQQEVKLTLEYEANQAEYKQEMEQHFAQRMQSVRYEWERKFNKALQKVKKELEKRHMKELRQLKPDQHPRQLHQNHPLVSYIADESSLHGEHDVMPSGARGAEKLDAVEDHLLQEHQEIAHASDAQMEQIEITQTDITSEKQREITSRKSSFSSSSTTSTPTLTACSPVVAGETGRDEAEYSKSEVSDTSSGRERFLEELEVMSQQSSQDLPLEWELTSTVIETGSFEREPEHHSVWEVFDGRCVRQDCQEVRHKFHTLYHWVVNLLGDGYDVVFDSEFKLLTELSKDHENSSKSPSLNQSEVDSVNSSDCTAIVRDISYVELLARVVSLELTKQKLEVELEAQIDLNSKLELEMIKQYEVMDGELNSEVTQRTTVQHQGNYSVVTFKVNDTCTTGSLSDQTSASQDSDCGSSTVESLVKPRAQTQQELHAIDNVLTGRSGVSVLQKQSVYIPSDKVPEHLSCKQLDCYSCDDTHFLTSDRDVSECRSDGNSLENEREVTVTNIPEGHYSNETHNTENESTISVSSNNLRSTYLDGAGNESWSHIEMLDLQDKELAEELNRLQHDLREAKEVFSKESVLLQEALHKDSMSKNLTHTMASEKNVTSNANVSLSDSRLRKSEAHGNWDLLGQKLTICMEQNQMLEDENVSLRKKIREQSAVINFLKSRLQQKDQETEVWQKSVNKQLITLQNQRCDLLQLLQDMDSGKESKLSATLQGSLREESLRAAQEDLKARMEELDHLNKMLTQRQVELQHCEAERKHLEQLCLLKDETEIQLMKQKRLMEEQLNQIESHLTERENVLMEEKTQLLQELKDNRFHLSKVPEWSQTSSQSLSSHIPLPSVSGGMSLNSDQSATPVLSHSSSQPDAQDVDRKHSEAVEKLRAKLKQYKT
ncbi:hypothetical protein BsWGS_01796 [Bradybaena similaris]